MTIAIHGPIKKMQPYTLNSIVLPSPGTDWKSIEAKVRGHKIRLSRDVRQSNR